MNHLGPRVHGARISVVALVVGLLAALTASCTTSGSSPGSSSAQFCSFWDKVAAAPPAPDNAVLVKSDVVAMADTTNVTGQQCTDPHAAVDLQGATLAEGQELPSQLGTTTAPPIAAVTGDELSGGTPVLENLKLTSFSATIGLNGITVRGNVAVRISGTTSTIGFTGTLADLNNWSISLSSSALNIPGITTSPATFNGTLRSTNGVPSLSLTAAVTSAKIGDVTVNGASIHVDASTITGVSADVAGSIKVGPSTANGNVHVDFDRAGALVSAHADINAHLVGTQAGGKKIDLQGSLKLDGNAQKTTASFSASGMLGDLVVHQANGSLTLAATSATFVGVLDIAQGANYVRFDGSIVWDGNVAYTPFLNLQAGGQYSGTLNDGQNVTVSGTLDTTVVGGQLHTQVTGDFTIGTLKATGSAIVDTNGATTTLSVDANLVNAGFSAELQGAVVITDGLAETVSLDAVVNGTVDLGDAELSNAQLHISSSYGSPLDISFSGGLKVGSDADLTGSVDASFGPDGSLISLDGNMTGSLQLESWGVLNFNGAVVASPDQITLTGSGAIALINFPAGITFQGSFTSSLTNPSWSLNGSGQFRIASIQVASARLNLSQGVGMKATRVGFYFDIVGIPTYFEGNFYMKPTGGCTKVDITAGNLIAKGILALVLPGVIGCPVNI